MWEYSQVGIGRGMYICCGCVVSKEEKNCYINVVESLEWQIGDLFEPKQKKNKKTKKTKQTKQNNLTNWLPGRKLNLCCEL